MSESERFPESPATRMVMLGTRARFRGRVAVIIVVFGERGAWCGYRYEYDDDAVGVAANDADRRLGRDRSMGDNAFFLNSRIAPMSPLVGLRSIEECDDAILCHYAHNSYAAGRLQGFALDGVKLIALVRRSANLHMQALIGWVLLACEDNKLR